MGRMFILNADAIVTMAPDGAVLRNASLLIDGPFIRAVGGDFDDESLTVDNIIDARGCVITPGFVNTHHHLTQTLTRAVPRVQDAKLFDWLVDLYEIWREITPEAVDVGVRVGLAELLLTGCTTVADHMYLFPAKGPADLLDISIRAAADLGVRFHPTRGSMSRGRSKGGLPPDDVVQSEDAILRDCERVAARYHDPAPGSMCRVALAPCSPFSVTSELMRESAVLARRLGLRLHTHLAETLDEQHFCIELHSKRPLDYMESLGWLGPDVWFAHGVHFNDAELQRLAATRTGIAHCPTSNMRLGSGVARVPAMVEAGVPVGLAVDGSASNDASNFLREVQNCLLVHRIGTGVDAMPVSRALRLATVGGAEVLGRDDIGVIAPGKVADLAIWRLDDIGYAGAALDPVAALLFCGTRSRTAYTVVNGEVVVRDGRLLHVDEADLIQRANRVARDMAARAAARTGLRFDLPRRAERLAPQEPK